MHTVSVVVIYFITSFTTTHHYLLLTYYNNHHHQIKNYHPDFQFYILFTYYFIHTSSHTIVEEISNQKTNQRMD